MKSTITMRDGKTVDGKWACWLEIDNVGDPEAVDGKVTIVVPGYTEAIAALNKLTCLKYGNGNGAK